MVALLLAAACAPWALLVACRGGLLATSLAVLAAGICTGHEFWHTSLAGLPVTLDRLAWCVLVGQTVLWRAKGWAKPQPWTVVECTLLLFAGYLSFSALSFGASAPNMDPKAICLFFYLLPVGMYWVMRQTPYTELQLRIAGMALGLFGCYLAFTAYAETHDRWSWVFPAYARSPAYVEFFGRGRGPLLNPIGNGLLMIACMTASLLTAFRCGKYLRIACLLAALVCLLGCYYTYTRSVWMGATAALGIVIWANAPSSWRRWLLACAVLGGGAIIVARWDSLMAFKRDKDLTAAETADSVLLRPILASIAMNMTADHPMFGVGLARYLAHNHAYAYEYENPLPLERGLPYVQHNLFLSLLVETGIIGLGLFVSLLAGWAVWAAWLWRRRDIPFHERQIGLFALAMLAAHGVNAMFHEVSLIPMVNMVMFSTLGLCMGSAVRCLRSLGRPECRIHSGGSLGWSTAIGAGAYVRR